MEDEAKPLMVCEGETLEEWEEARDVKEISHFYYHNQLSTEY